MYKVLVVFGTRPEAIKMCPLIIQLRKIQEIQCIVCLTGQHKEMLAQVMDVFQINADYNLSIMRCEQTLNSITSDVLKGFGSVLQKEKPDFVLVHGDTTTSFAAALAAFYEHIPIGHVEAGLRTYDIKSPYPEEFNRLVVDLMSNFYFAPTEKARNNLLMEGKKESQIFVTGNTVIDALKTTLDSSYQNEDLTWASDSKMILLTAHRRENLGAPMRRIFTALKRIVKEFPDVKVIFPIHKNPKVRSIAREVFAGEERIRMVEPLDIVGFHNFMANSYFVMTDSGGIQEEAPALGKPVLVLRNTTERPEGVDAGTLWLCGTDSEIIYLNTKELLTNINRYMKMSVAMNPYGDGHASERICNIILNLLK